MRELQAGALVFGEDGAHAALLEARQAGKLRYIGFTGHKDPRIHLYMLEVARENGFTFDAVQMPLNVMDAHFRSFSRLVLPELATAYTDRSRALPGMLDASSSAVRAAEAAGWGWGGRWDSAKDWMHLSDDGR